MCNYGCVLEHCNSSDYVGLDMLENLHFTTSIMTITPRLESKWGKSKKNQPEKQLYHNI